LACSIPHHEFLRLDLAGVPKRVKADKAQEQKKANTRHSELFEALVLRLESREAVGNLIKRNSRHDITSRR
jgi:hypothetical protein